MKELTFPAKPTINMKEELFNSMIKPGLFFELITKDNKFYYLKLIKKDSIKIEKMNYEEYSIFKENHYIEYNYDNFTFQYKKKKYETRKL